MWSVVVEESISNKLKTVCGEGDNEFSVGVLIGQVNASKRKVFIVHIAPTPEQSNTPDVKALEDVDEELVASHARFTTRMLPGGLNILGIFVITSKDAFSPPSLKIIKRILLQIDKNFKSGFPLDVNTKCSERFVLHINPQSNRYVCKGMPDTWTGGITDIDVKFHNSLSSWIEMVSEANINEKDFNVSSSASVKEQFMELLLRFKKTIEESAVVFNGRSLSDETDLKSLAPRKEHNSAEQVIASLFYRFPETSTDTDVKFFTSDCQRITVGIIPSKVLLNPDSTVGDAAAALTQDLVRSLGARLELHWDSLVDDEGGCPEEKERVHEPPRRVLLQADDSRLFFYDYLFPGENASNAVSSCSDLLDIQITERNVIDDFEVPADSAKYINGADNYSTNSSSVQFVTKWHLIISICGVILLAILAHFILQTP